MSVVGHGDGGDAVNYDVVEGGAEVEGEGYDGRVRS